jgi:3-oxoacyl-(acyl-carrier-protein) synthase
MWVYFRLVAGTGETMSKMTIGKLERKIAALQAKVDEFTGMEQSKSLSIRTIAAHMVEDFVEQMKPWQEKRDRMLAWAEIAEELRPSAEASQGIRELNEHLEKMGVLAGSTNHKEKI